MSPTIRQTQSPKRARRDHQMRMAAQVFDEESLMDMPLLCMFFGGKSLPTISRWRKDPDPTKRLPPPDLFMGAVPYWKRKTIIAYRDRRAAMPKPVKVSAPPPGRHRSGQGA